MLEDQQTSSGGTRRTQQERSEAARARLLGAAIELICEVGVAHTTLAEVASRAGFTRGAIQHHFAGRDELVLAIIQHVETEILESFDAVPPREDAELGPRVDFLIDLLGEICRRPAYLAVVNIWLAARFSAQLDEEVRKSMLRSSDAFKRLWLRMFADDVPPEAIDDCRRVVITLMRGIVVSQVLIANLQTTRQTLETCKTMVKEHMLRNK